MGFRYPDLIRSDANVGIRLQRDLLGFIEMIFFHEHDSPYAAATGSIRIDLVKLLRGVDDV